MTEREQERAAVVAWLRKEPLAPASIFSWRARLFYAWWGLRNPAVFMTTARIAVANAIERGEHIGKE